MMTSLRYYHLYTRPQDYPLVGGFVIPQYSSRRIDEFRKLPYTRIKRKGK